MADRRYSAVFFAAIVIAGVATFGVYRTLEATKARSRIVTRPVVVAAKDMNEGTSLDQLSLTTAQWPEATVPAGAFSSVDSIVGRVTRVAVFKGEALVPGRLAPAGTGPGLEVRIAPGKRAMSLKINDVTGLNGLIQPNSRVDVLVTLSEGDGRGNQVAKLFMENMRVLSVGTQVQRDMNGKPIEAATATLEVTPEEAEELAIATTAGTIQLVLRGYGDPDSVKTGGAKKDDVLRKLRDIAPAARTSVASRPAPPRRAPAPRPAAPPPPPPQAAPARPDSLVVRIWRGEKQSTQKFEQRDSSQHVPPR